MNPSFTRSLLSAAVALATVGMSPSRGADVFLPFDKPEDLAGWKSEYESWVVRDNALTQHPALASGRRAVLWCTGAQYGDIDLSIDFLVPMGDMTGAGLAVLYRAKGPTEYFAASIDPRPGRLSAVLYRSDVTKEANSPVKGKPFELEPDSWHTLRVVAKGGQHEMYLNGELLASDSDTTYTAGAIGLRLNWATTKFRNLRIKGSATPAATSFEVPNLPFVTVCDDSGPGHYEGFPVLARAKNGDLLCVFFSGYKHVPSTPNELMPKGGRIAMVRSSDNGRTWSKSEVIYDSDIDDHDPEITALSDGRLAVTICRWPVKGTHKPFIIWSEDDGKTWSDATAVDAGSELASTEVPQGPIVELPNKELLMPTYGTVAAGEMSSAVVRRSVDGGKTWTFTPQQVMRSTYTEKTDANVHEPCIVRLPDGKLMMIARQKMFRWESTDDGKTWAPLADLPFRGDSPQLFMTSKNILLMGVRFRGADKAGKNRGTCVAYSKDFGKTWSEPVMIAPVIGGYTGFAELPDGRVFVVYYTEGNGFSDIRGAWLKVDESGVQVLPNE